MKITNTLANCTISDLLRAYKSNKPYLYFDISVFNVGAIINIRVTNTYKSEGRNWNGYNFIIDNDTTTKSYIKEAFKLMLNDSNILKTKTQLTKIRIILKK